MTPRRIELRLPGWEPDVLATRRWGHLDVVQLNQMNFNKYHHQLLLLLITFFSSALIWFLFYKNIPKFLGFPATSLETIYANYDGPNYMIIAKCGYNKDCIRQQFSLPLPLEYYPAHLPAFPLLIKIFSLFLTTPKAMLLVCLLGSAFFTLSCYYFFRLFFSEKKSFWLSFLIIFFILFVKFFSVMIVCATILFS